MDKSNEAIKLEIQFSEKGYHGSSDNPAILVKKGRLPIVISAPHAVKHPRDGIEKWSEPFTGALALQLASRTGASAIIHARTTQEDPNYDKPGLYKEALAELVRETKAGCVLDLHGMADSFEIKRHGLEETIKRDVIIGTANKKALRGRNDFLEALKEALQSNGITNVAVDEYFTADEPNTITRFIADGPYHVPAMQIEIARSFRKPNVLPQKYEAFVLALIQAINTIVLMLTQQSEHLNENVVQQPRVWQSDLEEHKALLKAAREHRKRYRPTGEVYVYPPLREE